MNGRTDVLPAWLRGLLACPACGGPLKKESAGWRCGECEREYPLRFGIPDFRLLPDPFISIDDEAAKIERIFGARPASFEECLQAYYELSPENPPSLNRHYREAMRLAERRGGNHIDRLQKRFPDAARGSLIDIGCGTAGLIANALARPRPAAGVDVALRWLVIGRQRLRERGLPAPLLCANAEHLPLRGGSFRAALSDAALEHVRDSRRMLDEMLRVLEPGGAYFLATNNRFSLMPEPHVRIWGFAFTPRRWHGTLALRLRGTPYRARLHSLAELRRIFRRGESIELPRYRRGELGGSREGLRRVWNRLRRWKWWRMLLRPFSPQYHIWGRKPEAEDPSKPGD